MKNRISELRKARGWSQTDLAERIGVKWQTISRLENSRNTIMQERAEALAKAFAIQPYELYSAPPQKGLRFITVRQAVRAGYFAESLEWPDGDTYEVAILDSSRTKNLELYGAEVVGPSMNEVYPEGTVVIYSAFQGNLEPSRRYLVERTRADGLRESTVKTLRADSAGELWLVPESKDPSFAPIPIHGQEGETITIVGRVQFAVIPQ